MVTACRCEQCVFSLIARRQTRNSFALSHVLESLNPLSVPRIYPVKFRPPGYEFSCLRFALFSFCSRDRLERPPCLCCSFVSTCSRARERERRAKKSFTQSLMPADDAHVADWLARVCLVPQGMIGRKQRARAYK
jgi:hypothetical protein